MPRAPRIHVPGAQHHVMLRGNARQRIFFSRADRLAFEDLVAEGIERFGHRIHAYCWMPNHVHLMVEVAGEPLSRIVQNIAFRYARWFNRRRRSVGHVFQGRFRSIVVQQDSYLLELLRYIHLNPVRGELVEAPEHYPWSGHGAYLGTREVPWLTTTHLLAMFDAGNLARARIRYRRFVQEAVGEACLNSGPTEEAAADNGAGPAPAWSPVPAARPAVVRRQPPSLDAVISTVAARYGLDEASIAAPGRHRAAARARAAVAWLALRSGAATLAEVGERFRRDASTLSKVATRHGRDEARGWTELLQRLDEESQ